MRFEDEMSSFFTSSLGMYFEWVRRDYACILINLRFSYRSPDILQQVARIAQRYKKVSLHKKSPFSLFLIPQPQDRYAVYMQKDVYVYFHGKYIHGNCKGKIRFRATFTTVTKLLCVSINSDIMYRFVTILPCKWAMCL